MAYTKKTWENRNTEFESRYLLTNVDTSKQELYDIEPFEGVIRTDGDPYSAKVMNDLEQRISDGFRDAEDADSQSVKIDTTQTIKGAKTFLFPPVLSVDPAEDAQAARKSYVDAKSESAAANASAAAVGNAMTFKKTAIITAGDWIPAGGYYYKSTGHTLPPGYDGEAIGLSIPPESLVVLNNSQSGFAGVYDSGGVIYIACGLAPNSNISIILTFSQTRTS